MRKPAAFTVVFAMLSVLTVASASAQPKSPRGTSTTQTGSGYEKWVTVEYGRPILRGRQGIFGEGETYGKKVNAGAPVWRAGADKSTRLKSDAALSFGEVVVPAGEYSLFVELRSPTEWVLILSKHEAQERYDPDDKVAIWGAYGYSAGNDLVRVPMAVTTNENSIDQLSYVFSDVSEESGSLVLAWDRTIAVATFAVSK